MERALSLTGFTKKKEILTVGFSVPAKDVWLKDRKKNCFFLYFMQQIIPYGFKKTGETDIYGLVRLQECRIQILGIGEVNLIRIPIL